jgi:IclR family transcriptional regulator, acetate operon repressor
MAKAAKRRGPAPVQSVGRSLDLLDAVAAETLGLVALAERAGLGASTAYRLLSTLMEHGYVRRNPSTGHFHVGYKLLELAASAAHDTEVLRAIVRPYLDALRNATDETANLVVPDGVSVVYIDQVESARAIRMFTAIGRRVPLHASASGKAILASSSSKSLLADRETAGLAALTPHTLITSRALEHDLDRTRTRGFAIDNEEHDLGVVCVAAAIIGHDGEPTAALSVSGPSERMRAADLDALGAIVRTHSLEASRDLGAGSRPSDAA